MSARSRLELPPEGGRRIRRAVRARLKARAAVPAPRVPRHREPRSGGEVWAGTTLPLVIETWCRLGGGLVPKREAGVARAPGNGVSTRMASRIGSPTILSARREISTAAPET
jgi:hypothetical protein